jgi:excisionase family DNA binding protein
MSQTVQKLVPEREAARQFGLGPKQLRDAAKRGELRTYRVGGWRRVRLEDVAAWIETRLERPVRRRPS